MKTNVLSIFAFRDAAYEGTSYLNAFHESVVTAIESFRGIIIEGEGGGGIETWNDENSDDYSPQSDINGDGIVNVLDIVLLLNLILAGEG